MQFEVELVETATMVAAERCLLFAHIRVERAQQSGVGARHDGAYRFGFQCAADEHGLPAIGKVDARDARAALREYLDKALGGETPERFRHRKARHPEPCA